MRLPLRVFLFVSLSVATLAPIVYLGPREVARWREIQRRDSDQELQLAAELLARAIGRAIEESRRGITTMANHIGTYGSFEAGRLQSVLHHYCQTFPSCMGINICNLDGQPIVIEPADRGGVRLHDRGYYQEMLRTGQTAISGVEMGRITRVPTIHVCAPIWTEGGATGRELMGAVVGALGLGYFQDLTTRSVAFFGDMQARVLDQERHVIVAANPIGVASLADLSGNDLYAPAAGDTSWMRDGRDEQGTPVRAALARVSEAGLGWTVAVMRPHWKIEEQAAHTQASIRMATFGALGLGVLLAFVLSSWLARPISRLARYTQKVAGGESIEAPSSATWDAREVTELVTTVSAMVTQLRHQADVLREQEQEKVVLARFRRELEIAEHIQTAMLPKGIEVPGFEIAAAMRPAETVGGDYYDFQPAPGGLWLGVGDVSGHGLTAGLVMLMVQSALGALSLHAPAARPAELWSAVNRLLVGNIRHRLGGDDHVTLVLVHLAADGSFVFAGGHEPILILRRGAATCEIVSTPGPWMGVRPDPAVPPAEHAGRLAPGDLMVFHSDGIVETGAREHNQFGLERLGAAVVRLREAPAQAICAEIVREAGAWGTGVPDDDMSVVVVRKT